MSKPALHELQYIVWLVHAPKVSVTSWGDGVKKWLQLTFE